jgi:hypothetical protein
MIIRADPQPFVQTIFIFLSAAKPDGLLARLGFSRKHGVENGNFATGMRNDSG